MMADFFTQKELQAMRDMKTVDTAGGCENELAGASMWILGYRKSGNLGEAVNTAIPTNQTDNPRIASGKEVVI